MLEISPSHAVKNREMQCSSQRCPSDNVESYLVCVFRAGCGRISGGDQKASADAAWTAQRHHQTHGQTHRQHPGSVLIQTTHFQISDCLHSPEYVSVHQVPMARASILWLIGEYCEHVPKIAPDVLRKMAKTFTNEEDIVKLQIINLAAKLYLTNSKQVSGWAYLAVASLTKKQCYFIEYPEFLYFSV